jgi:hypothetical protein
VTWQLWQKRSTLIWPREKDQWLLKNSGGDSMNTSVECMWRELNLKKRGFSMRMLKPIMRSALIHQESRLVCLTWGNWFLILLTQWNLSRKKQSSLQAQLSKSPN